MPPPTRLSSLDGLRGVAAVVVMIYHMSLVARPFLDTGSDGDTWWWLTQTPLKLFTAGTEAVLVFFVLSGLVVTLPALREGFRTSGYLASRLVRLYLPVWGSLLLAAALIALVPRRANAVSDGSWTDRANADAVAWPQLLSEASLWRISYDLNNVLWSLRWELVFSLALPLFAVLALTVRRYWLPAAALATVIMIAGRLLEQDALTYLPAFFLGSLMAVRLDDLLAWSRRQRTRTWVLLATSSSALLIASWLTRPLQTSSGADVLWALAALGAAGLVVVALGWQPVARALSKPVPQQLGRVSFSLYLVQAPVIATLAFAFGDRNWPLVVALGIPVCLLVAWGFFVAVERPSHRLARWTARTVNQVSERMHVSTGSHQIEGTRSGAQPRHRSNRRWPETLRRSRQHKLDRPNEPPQSELNAIRG